MGSGIDPDVRVSTLPAAERSLVAIGRALARAARISWFSTSRRRPCRRPTSTVCSTRCGACATSGIGIIYVTHRLDEVFRIADRVTVLRDGRRVATQRVAETSPDDLVEKIVGRSMSDAFVKPLPASDRIVLAVERRRRRRPSGRSPSTVAAGETLGLVGLRGAGHHTIGRAIFGQIPISARPYLAGRPSGRSRRSRGRHAQADRLRLQPARRGKPRREHGRCARTSISIRWRRGNGSCSPSGAGTSSPTAPPSSSASPSGRRIPNAVVATLSGGNQQKVVARPLDGGEGAASRARGADHRRRCRLQGGDLSSAAAVPEGGARRAAALLRFRGGGAHLPSRAGLQPRPRRIGNPAQ